MALKGYEDMYCFQKLDLSKYIEKRENAEYVNWARIVDLLHENGAEKVYFEPVVDTRTGSSLYMTDQVFTDKNGTTNRVYETAVHIVIDDLDFIQRGPVTNGSNPVKDNSMTQQRLWNCQTRLFVKGVAIRTGLGFNLWLQDEVNEEKNNWEDDLSKHNIFKVKERVQELYTQKYKTGLSAKEIAEKLHKTEEEVKAIFSYFDIINNFERDLANLDTKQGQKWLHRCF